MAAKLVRWMFVASLGLAGCHTPNPSGRPGPQSGIPPAPTNPAPKSSGPATVDGRPRAGAPGPGNELPPPSFPQATEKKSGFGPPAGSAPPQSSESRLPPGSVRIGDQPGTAFPQVNGPFNAPNNGLPAAPSFPQTVVPAGGVNAAPFPNQQMSVAPVSVPSLPATSVVPPPMPSASIPAIAPPGPATPAAPSSLQTNVYPSQPSTLR